jgi:hypothetical protein
MSALTFTLALSAGVGRTSYLVRQRPLRVVDTGSHILVRLEKPRPFWANERSLTVVRPPGDLPLRAHVVLALDHFGSPRTRADVGTESNDDDFPEFKDSCPKITSNVYDVMYGQAAGSSWANSLAESRTDGLLNSDVVVNPATASCTDYESAVAPSEHTPVSVQEVALPRLHRIFGHSSTAQLLHLLRQGSASSGILSQSLVDAVRRLKCSFCDQHVRRTPGRPRVSISRTTGPGHNPHLDIGHYFHPNAGSFAALITTDKFSS